MPETQPATVKNHATFCAAVGLAGALTAGRISGAKRIPISELKVGGFHRVEGRRLQVNDSTIRYQKQLRYLTSMI